MARWEPDAQGRLQQAAMELFLERGYAEVTVAEIADRAGLTKRTFFNHFADKREVLFAGAAAFEASVVRHLSKADDDLVPIDAAIAALTAGGLELARYRDVAHFRRDVIASSPELQERDVMKMTSLASAMAEALRQRDVPARTAILAAQAAVAVFSTAYGDWVADSRADFGVLMQQALAELRQAVGAAGDARAQPRRLRLSQRIRSGESSRSRRAGAQPGKPDDSELPMRIPKLVLCVPAMALGLAAGSVSAVPAVAATGTATVTVVHGIPNTPVDVYANGKKILTGFTFKTVTSPLSLPAGSYAIAVRKAGASASSTPILSATEQVPGGANVTIVADLTAAGKPALTPFVNDTSAVGSGKGRLVVRHTAAAPAVDVYAGSTKAISGLTNGQQQALTVPAGTVPAKVTLAGQTAPVIGPVNVPVTAGMATVVYAVGSASDQTLTAVTQQYPLGGMARSAQAGSGGLGADPASPAWPFGLTAAVGLMLAVAGAAGIVRRRRAC